jgi:hypothetical protein
LLACPPTSASKRTSSHELGALTNGYRDALQAAVAITGEESQ